MRTHMNLIKGVKMLERQWGSLESIRSNYTLCYMCRTPVTVKCKSRKEYTTLNLDPISEHRVLYKQSLLNQVVSVREWVRNCQLKKLLPRGCTFALTGGLFPWQLVTRPTVIPTNQTFLPNILSHFLFHHWFLPPVIVSVKQVFPTPWSAR